MKMISVRADDGHAFDVYLSGGASADAPVVLMYPPIFGLEQRVLAMADRWASEGYLVAVPDYLSRGQPAGVLQRGDSQAIERWNQIDVLRAIEDSRALLAELNRIGHSTARFGAMGYCGGGELVWLAASRLGAAVAVGFHPTRLTRHLAEAARMDGALSLHFGAEDKIVPLTEVAQIQNALASNPRSDVHVYGAAQHGFTFTDLPAYHPAAERASRRHTLDLLRAALQPERAGND